MNYPIYFTFILVNTIPFTRPLSLMIPSKPTKSQEFTLKLIKDKFSHCTLLFFQDRHDNSDTLDYIVENTDLNYFNVKYIFPTESEINDLISSVDKFNLHLPQKNITAEISSPLTLPLVFPISVSNYHRRSDQCLVAVLMINDLRSEFISQVNNLLTPVYIPITRKDLDNYIFLTEPSRMNELLLMKELPGRIKFRIGVGESKGQLVIRSACFFCAEGGNPKVLEYPSSEGYIQGFNYFPDYVLDLNGKILKVACPYIRARIEADPPYEGLKNARRGVWKHLLEEFMMVKFNFTYNMFASTGKDGNLGGGGTGLQLPNGTWIGVTGDLISGKADMGVVTANTPLRIQVIDFTEAFFDIGYLTFVTSEGERIYSPAAFLWPFDLLMWFCILICTLVAFSFFFLMIKSIFWLKLGDLDALKFARRGMVSNQIWTFKYQVQFIVTSFLDQDCVMPTFLPLRTFVAIWLFFTLVVTTAYRTKLVSLLAFPIIEELPKDFDDLAYSEYEVGFMKHGDSAYNTLKASTDPVYVKLINEMEVIEGYGLPCLEKVVKQKYGCIAYDFSLQHLRERNLSESDTRKLVIAPAHTYNAYFGLSAEGKSILLINFSKWLSLTRAFHLQKIWEGIDLYYTVRSLKRDWWFSTNQSEKANIMDPSASNDDNLTMKHISGAFYVLFGLLIVCTIFFGMELAHFNREKIRRKVEDWIDTLKVIGMGVRLQIRKIFCPKKKNKRVHSIQVRHPKVSKH